MHIWFLLFIVPSPFVEVTNIDTVEYGKTTTLECNAFVARGITSKVEIIWETVKYFFQTVKKVDNVTANTVNNSVVYTDQIVIPPLSANDKGRVYRCLVNITSTFATNGDDSFILDFIGT